MKTISRKIGTPLLVAFVSAMIALAAFKAAVTPADAADTFHYRGKSAQFSYYEHGKGECVSTNLHVFVGENAYREGRERETWTSLSVGLHEYDWCLGKEITNAHGWIGDLDDNEYNIHQSLRNAYLDIVVELYDKFSGKWIKISLDLTWEEDGSQMHHGSDRYVYQTPHFVMRSRSNGRRIGANIIGTAEECFEEGCVPILVLTDEADAWATISKDNGGTVVIERR